MSGMGRLILGFSAAPFAFLTFPAAACDTGPFTIEFARGTAKLTSASRASLQYVALLRREWPDSRIRITIYNDGVSGPASRWKERFATALAQLRAERTSAASIDIVRIKASGGMLGGRWIGRATSMQAEVTRGCGA